MKNKIFKWLLLGTIVLAGCQNKEKTSTDEKLPVGEVPVEETPVVKEDTSFCFLGMARDREENFDKCPVPVTESNVEHLYRKYKVEKIEGTDLYRVTPHKFYDNARYFTRLLKFSDGRQVAALTFYCYDCPYVFPQQNGYLIGINSIYTNSGYNVSSFYCKTILLDDSLKIVKERRFRFPEQDDAGYAYSYIHKLDKSGENYEFTIINVGFDPGDYYEYTGVLSKDNVVLSSIKRNVLIDYSNSTSKSEEEPSHN